MTHHTASDAPLQQVFSPLTALDSVSAGFQAYEEPIYERCRLIDAPFDASEVEEEVDDGFGYEWEAGLMEEPGGWNDLSDAERDAIMAADWWADAYHPVSLGHLLSQEVRVNDPIPGFEGEITLHEYLATSPVIPNKWDARKPIPQPLRWAVFKRDGYACAECGRQCDLTADHIIAYSLGGPTSSWNLRTLCRPCNSHKGNR